MTQTEKYIWLLNTIHQSRSRGISLREISDKWRDYMSTEKPLDRATFNRWKTAVELQFHVNIECNTKGGYRYYITNPDDINDDRVRKWLLDSVSTGTTLLSNLDIKDRILLEEIPSGRANLATIVSAMKHNHKVQITYRGFGKIYSSTFAIEPLCVKLYNNRWYVVGDSYPNGEWRRSTYGLDRIEETIELKEEFAYPQDFDAKEYFHDYIGVSRWVDPVEEPIRFRVYNPHKYYIMSLPIHHSQRLVVDEGDYAEFEVKVAPTEEFFMEMLHGGSWIEVLSPKEVVDQMKGWVEELYNVYNKK
ncbi:YafY family protein [Bacteroides caecimuris]|uniref:helix-turn-helix transcriptional regulator n=1 Tax=Bacteroides caecimuris TaxID=1796613 RepID=UPI002649FA01|nr:WYL domain-containing protein [Bacteroides caecimuris]